MAEIRRDVFQAIADPTRREILDLLSSGPQNLNSIANNFDISRPAISQQIKILTECGLIVVHSQGRERYCEVRLKKLSEVSEWIEKYQVFWTKKLDALENFLKTEEIKGKSKNKTHERKIRKNNKRG